MIRCPAPEPPRAGQEDTTDGAYPRRRRGGQHRSPGHACHLSHEPAAMGGRGPHGRAQRARRLRRPVDQLCLARHRHRVGHRPRRAGLRAVDGAHRHGDRLDPAGRTWPTAIGRRPTVLGCLVVMADGHGDGDHGARPSSNLSIWRDRDGPWASAACWRPSTPSRRSSPTPAAAT